MTPRPDVSEIRTAQIIQVGISTGDAVDDPDDEVRVAIGEYIDINDAGGQDQVVYIEKSLNLHGSFGTPISTWSPAPIAAGIRV